LGDAQAKPNTHRHQVMTSDPSILVTWGQRAAQALIILAIAAPLLIPVGGEAMVLLLALIGAASLVIEKIKRRRNLGVSTPWSRQATWMALALASIVLLQLVSILWSAWPKQSMASALKHVHFVLWPLLVIALSRAHAPQRMMEYGLLTAMGLTTLWMLLPVQTGWAGNQFEAAGQNPSVFGKMVAVYGLWAMVLASGTRRSAQTGDQAALALKMRSAMALVWGCGLLLLVAADRRIELGLYVALSVMFMLLRLFKRGQLRLAVSLMCAASVLMGTALFHKGERFAKAGQEVQQYFSAKQPRVEDYQTSLGQRMEMYHIALQAIENRPWLGWGAGARPQYLKEFAHFPQLMFERTHLHSQYLQTLVDIGILGSLASIAALVVAWRISVVRPWQRGEHEVAALFAALYSVHMLSGLFNPAFSQGLSNSFFVTMAAVLWVIHHHQSQAAAISARAL
jgi:O-antigen ligase